jgi:hypothetical protein
MRAAQVLASELAALLTLQLSSLAPAVLSGVVGAVGQLRAAPRWVLWADKAAAAVERATGRYVLFFTSMLPVLVVCLLHMHVVWSS